MLYSNPCHGASGGDVHYCSMCNSGIIARVCLADVAGHGERVAGVARVMHAELRASVNRWDEREVMQALDVRLEQSGLKAITTAALVSYRPWKQLLTVSYAGHPPGWIYRAGGDGQGRRWERLLMTETVASGPADLPLGTGFGPAYSRTQVRALPGRSAAARDGRRARGAGAGRRPSSATPASRASCRAVSRPAAPARIWRRGSSTRCAPTPASIRWSTTTSASTSPRSSSRRLGRSSGRS